jgi:hypothetical protein
VAATGGGHLRLRKSVHHFVVIRVVNEKKVFLDERRRVSDLPN